MSEPHLLLIPIVVVLITSVVAAVTDIWKFKVHNLLTFPLLFVGLIYHGAVGGMEGLKESSLGILFGFGAPFLLYIIGGLGAGDVKFLAAIGAWLGFLPTLLVFLMASIAAGVYAVVLLFLFGGLRETWVNLQVVCLRLWSVGRYLGGEDRIETEVIRPDRRRRLIPFTAMVALGIVTIVVGAFLSRPQ
jgi:prepilin peptidase CpaA